MNTSFITSIISKDFLYPFFILFLTNYIHKYIRNDLDTQGKQDSSMEYRTRVGTDKRQLNRAASVEETNINVIDEYILIHKGDPKGTPKISSGVCED